MSKTIQHTYVTHRVSIPVEGVGLEKKSALQTLSDYIAQQSAGPYRFKWMGISMGLQAMIITPLVSVIILFTGNWTPLWFAATASMYSVFLPSLSGQSIRWIMEVFFANIVFSLLLIAMAIFHGIVT